MVVTVAWNIGGFGRLGTWVGVPISRIGKDYAPLSVLNRYASLTGTSPENAATTFAAWRVETPIAF